MGYFPEKYVPDDPDYYTHEFFEREHYKPGKDLIAHVRGYRITIEYFEHKGAEKRDAITINKIGFRYWELIGPKPAKENPEQELKQ